jgi:hypothetical protein
MQQEIIWEFILIRGVEIVNILGGTEAWYGNSTEFALRLHCCESSSALLIGGCGSQCASFSKGADDDWSQMWFWVQFRTLGQLIDWPCRGFPRLP